MTVHFFTFSDITGGSSRHRAFWMADHLRELGMNIVIHTPPIVTIARTPWPRKAKLIVELIRTLPSIKKGDVVYLQRATYSKYFFLIMVCYTFLFRRKMIFDFDDPIYVHSYFKTKVFCQMADLIITCTHGQAEWARQFNSHVEIIHIAVASGEYEKFTKDYDSSHGKIIIGWTGVGPEHLKNLPLLVPVFKKLVEKDARRLKFILIGAFGDQRVYDLFSIPELEVEFIDKAEPKSMPERIGKFDIGVVPHQTEGEWNKSKTSLKVLEYMACGVPAVATKFGEMPYIITDGVDGFVASATEEWVEKIERLMEDSKLRESMGRAGQQRVKEGYSFGVLAPRLKKLIEDVAAL